MKLTPTTKTWADFPYEFNPKTELSNKDLTELLTVLFSVKVFPTELYDVLPENLQEHFTLREHPELKPGVKNVGD